MPIGFNRYTVAVQRRWTSASAASPPVAQRLDHVTVVGSRRLGGLCLEVTSRAHAGAMTVTLDSFHSTKSVSTDTIRASA